MIAGLLAVTSASAGADETCRFAGSTDYNGHVAVAAHVTKAGGVTIVRVTAFVEAKLALWPRLHYFAEETSTWRAGNLEQVAVNNRYLSGDRIMRQQWDVFDRSLHGLQARRVQGKTLADFQNRHAGFVQHWDPATFGRPWLQDYNAANAEPRHDLGLAETAMNSGVRPPLALAFYWTRWLPSRETDLQVFLPGFKSDRLAGARIVDLPLTPNPALEATLRSPALDGAQASTVVAHLTQDHHLQRLLFDLHGRHRSISGTISAEGCTGTPVTPSGSE